MNVKSRWKEFVKCKNKVSVIEVENGKYVKVNCQKQVYPSLLHIAT